VTIAFSRRSMATTPFDAASPQEAWRPPPMPEPERPARAMLARCYRLLRPLLRPLAWRMRGFLLQDVIPRLAALQHGQAELAQGITALATRGERAQPTAIAPAKPCRKVHQFHAGSATGDAITNAMLLLQRHLRRLGYDSEIYAEHIGEGLEDQLLPLDALPRGADVVLLVHHSMGHGAFDRLLASPARKILIYHNITPPELLAHNRHLRDAAVLGRTQLALWRDHVTAAIADSAFNGVELRRLGYPCVLEAALLFDVATMGGACVREAEAPYTVMFVGRLAPSKGQAALIAAFAVFARGLRAATGRASRLVLIGAEQTDAPAYRCELDRLARATEAGAEVLITGKISDAPLRGWYRRADLYVSLSQHEGFGVPLVEAMAYGLPVLALRAAAVAETLGPRARLLDHARPDHVAEAMLRVAVDTGATARLVAQQSASLSRWELSRHLAVLQQALALAGVAPPVAAETHRIVRSHLRLDVTAGRSTAPLAAALLRWRPEAVARDEVAPGELVVRIADQPGGRHRPAPLLVMPGCDSTLLSPDGVSTLNEGADGVLVPSRFMARALRGAGVALPVHVTGHGHDRDWVARIADAAADALLRPPPEPPKLAVVASWRSGTAMACDWPRLAAEFRSPPVLFCETAEPNDIAAEDPDIVLIRHDPATLPWPYLLALLRAPALRRRCVVVLLTASAAVSPALRDQVCQALRQVACVLVAPPEALAMPGGLGLDCAMPYQPGRLEGLLTGLWRDRLDAARSKADIAWSSSDGACLGQQRTDTDMAAAGLERRHG
jgi:glycosyltransferase involved in cell wall biosynthesis